MAARFDLTDSDIRLIASARQGLADAQAVNLLDARAMARAIGRLEVTVERLIEMVDPPVTGGAA